MQTPAFILFHCDYQPPLTPLPCTPSLTPETQPHLLNNRDLSRMTPQSLAKFMGSRVC